MHEKTISTKKIYKGRIIAVRDDKVRLSNGVISHREIVEHPGAVAVIAVTKDKKLVLIEQFRKAANKALLEIPAGLAHKGEKKVLAAKRELLEESGFTAGKIKEIFWGYSSPGYSSEIIRFFLAEKLKKAEQNCDFDEVINVKLVPIKKCLRLVERGKIKDNKTIIGVLYASKWIT